MKNHILKYLKKYNPLNDRFVEVSGYKPVEAKNELLFFLKPEITIPGFEAIEASLDIVFENLNIYNLKVTGAAVLSSDYIRDFDIIGKHYGVINYVARNGKKVLTSRPKEKFKEIFNNDIDKVNILGGFEFLEKFKDYDYLELNKLWESGERKKLGAGIYCERHNIKGGEVYILNGFNPFQISFYTAPGRFILALTLQSDTDWKILRNDFIGVTNPFEAAAHSVRGKMLKIKDKYNIELNPGQNGVHLSAGPVEAMAEVQRFISDQGNKALSLEETFTGKFFVSAGIKAGDLAGYAANPLVNYNNSMYYLYDITEELNLEYCVHLLKKIQF